MISIKMMKFYSWFALSVTIIGLIMTMLLIVAESSWIKVGCAIIQAILIVIQSKLIDALEGLEKL